MRIEQVEKAAAALVENRLHRRRLVALPEDCRPQSEAGAYAVQRAQQARLAALGAPSGYKIGCTTPVMQRFLKIDHPCAGELFAETVFADGAELRHADYRRVGVECEIAVRLGRDLAPAGAPYGRADVAAAVAACMAAIEIVDDRYEDFRALDAWTLVADQFFNAGCVLGPAVEDFDAQNLDRVAGVMRVDGQTVGEGLGRDVLGHPLEALAWLANLQAERGFGLAAGDVVLLGSVVETKWPDAGQEVAVSLEGLGAASLRFS